MEAAAAARGSSMPMPPPPSRKEWRAVSDHHSARNIGDEELERSKLGQSDERTIYEVQQGREPVDVDFCSITVDGTLDHGLLQQRIEDVSRQREELQHMEIDLKAQIIARSEIMQIQHNFDAQIKEQANAASKLQEQLHEREQTIHDLERKMDEKDRELHAIKLDNEAAWAKEDLLREQNKELANIRRERDHSEAERTQHIQQLHDLQEHIQEKERQLNDLREQHRLAQEAILFKDEQLREAQAWITRVQEMDALQSTTIQAELRERTEQYNQLWLACQRQFAEMERLHMHTVQQLQLELADARERSGAYTDESRMTQSNSRDASQFGQNNGNQLDMNTSNGNTGPLQNGNSDDVSSFASTGNASTQIDHVAGVPISPSSLLGMPSYLPPGQVTALHPFLMHQQGVPHSVPPHVPQSHVGHFHSIPAISSLQQWQNQQAPSEGLQISAQNELPSSQNDPNLIRPDANYNYEASGNGQFLQQDYLDAQINQGAQPDSVLSSSTGEAQVLESIDRGYLVSSQPDQSLQQISSQFRNALRLESLEQNSETKVPEQNVQTSTDHGLDGQVLTAEQPSSTTNSLKSDNSIPSVNIKETAIDNATSAVLPEAFVSTGHANAAGGQTLEIALLDERSLLACMVRTIPAGGRIRISSTLPNRLGKMLAPLHWHDYKKKFGKLDDFVASHHELFVIEGDYIQLREGAQEMIAATAAVAKVAAAAAASSPYSSSLPSVAITPVAQTHRSRKISTSNANDNHLQSVKQNQHLNGLSFGIPGGFSNVKILSKSKDSWEPNGPDTRPSQSSVLMNGGNGALMDRSSMSSTQSSGLPNGRLSSNAVGKHGRMTNAAAFTSRRYLNISGVGRREQGIAPPYDRNLWTRAWTEDYFGTATGYAG